MTASKICYARPMASVCLALALAACGGGGGSETSVSPDQPVVIVPGSNGNTASPAPSPSPAPAPTPPTTTAPAPAKSVNPTTNAVYVGNQPAALAAYEAWLGERTEGIQLHTGRASWDDWESSIGWLAHEWKDVDRTKYWTIPLFEEAGNLDAAAAGNMTGIIARERGHLSMHRPVTARSMYAPAGNSTATGSRGLLPEKRPSIGAPSASSWKHFAPFPIVSASSGRPISAIWA